MPCLYLDPDKRIGKSENEMEKRCENHMRKELETVKLYLSEGIGYMGDTHKLW